MWDPHVARDGDTLSDAAGVVLPRSDAEGSEPRFLRWPASPLRGMRLVITAILVVVMVTLLLMGVNAAVSAENSMTVGAIVCMICMTVSIIDLYRRPGLSFTTQALHLVLTAATSLLDGALFLGGAVGQIAALTVGLYGTLRQCVTQCVLVQMVITGSVLVKHQVGIDAGMSAAASLQQSVGLIALTALTFSVSAVVGRYERIATRDAIVLRAGTALVAARTCQHIFTSVMNAVAALLNEGGGRAFIVRKEHGELLVLHGDTESEPYPFRRLPDTQRDGLDNSFGDVGTPASGSLDGLMVPLGCLQGDPVLLLVVDQPKLARNLVAALRALGPVAELAFRTVELTQELRRLAFHDTLTGLHNRAYLLDRLEQTLRHRNGPTDAVALLLIDLDGFKEVNDTLGHASGDELLVVTADRLRMCLPDAHLAVRLGGDEFVILMDGVCGAQEAVDVARSILWAVSQPLMIDDREVSIGASIGVALADTADANSEILLAQADKAMYAAKARGKGCIRLYGLERAAVQDAATTESNR